MGSNDIQQKMPLAQQLAYNELKNGKYKFIPIPNNVLNSEVQKYLKLSLSELKKRSKSLPTLLSGTKSPDLYDVLGFNKEQRVQADRVNKENAKKVRKLINNPKSAIKRESWLESRQSKQVIKLSDKQLRTMASETLYNMLRNASEALHQYHDSIGYLSGDAAWQGLKGIGNVLSFGNVETIWKEMDKIDALLDKTIQLRNSDNQKEFEKIYKEFTGMKYNPAAMQKFAALTQKGVSTESKEYQQSMKAAFGKDYSAETMKSIEGQQTKGSIMDIVMMIAGTEAISGLSLMQEFAEAAIKTLGVVGGSAAIGGVNMAAYTAITGSVNNVTKKAQTTSKDWTSLGTKTLEDFGVGAFGGLLNASVVSKITNFISKGESVTIGKTLVNLAKTGELSADNIMGTFIKSAPALAGKIAGFGTEILGFSLYTGAEKIAKSIISGDSPLGKNPSFDEICQYVKESMKKELKEQGLGLSEVKLIAKFIMMLKGGSIAQSSISAMTENIKDYKVKRFKGGYEIVSPKGKTIKTSNPDRLIGILSALMISTSKKTNQVSSHSSSHTQTLPHVEIKKQKSTNFEIADTENELSPSNPELKAEDTYGESSVKSKTPVAVSSNQENLAATNPESIYKAKPQKTKVKLKDFKILVPSLKGEQLTLSSQKLTKKVGKKIELNDEGEKLVWQTANDLNKNAGNILEDVKSTMINSDLATEKTLSARAKSAQSLHDKLRTYLIKNPNATLQDAIREVNDGVGTRTVIESIDFSNPKTKSEKRIAEKVQEYISKGDLKSAYNLAVEANSDFALKALKKIVKAQAEGTSKLKLTKISNYVGEDGIPYFTEHQLNELRAYAASKGLDIGIVTRVINPEDRVSYNDVYNQKSTTKIRESGYTALQMNFVTEKGDVIEWQCRGDKVNQFAEGEHVPYDLRTGKDIIGVHKELKPIYEPMKKLLSEKNMSDSQFAEYNAYLTAHYKYLHLVELGLEKPGNPPKLPKGFDTRLRAENLELLHQTAENLKNGEIKEADLQSEYYDKLVQNTSENMTDVSYRTGLDNIAINKSLDSYEAEKRLTNPKEPYRGKDPVIVRKACTDDKGNIKENLVNFAEYLQNKGFDDKFVANFVSNMKTNGTISPSVKSLIDTLLTNNKKVPKEWILVLVFSGTNLKNKSITKGMSNFISSFDITRNNLVALRDFIAKYKTDRGTIPSEVIKMLSKASNELRVSEKEKITQNGLQVMSAAPKTGETVLEKDFITTLEDYKKLKINGSILRLINEAASKYPTNPNLKDHYIDVVRYMTISKQNPASFKSVMASCTNKDGSFNQEAFDLLKNFVNNKIDSTKIAECINYLKDSPDGSFNQDAKDFIDKVLQDARGKNGRRDVLSSDIASLELKLHEKKGLIPQYNINKEKLALLKDLYAKLPEHEFEDKYHFPRIERINTLLESSIINVGGKETINKDLLNAVLEMDKANFSLNSILEISSKCLKDYKSGGFNSGNFNEIMTQYNKLSAEEKSKIRKIDVTIESSIVKQKITYKPEVDPSDPKKMVQPKAKIIDISYKDVNEVWGEYDESFAFTKSKNFKNSGTIYRKIHDSKRQMNVKSIYKKNNPASEIRKFKDPITGEEKVEYISDTGINGVMDIRQRDSHGNTKILSQAYKDKYGNTIISQDFTSLDGTRTQYDYKETKKGHNTSTYIITDASGKELLHQERTFTVVDDNHFKSTVNGHKYDMVIDENRKLTVTNDKGEKVSFDLDGFTGNNYPKFREILSKLPGEEFFNMKTTNLVSITPYNENNSCYRSNFNDINLGIGHTDLTVFLHEFGHNKDFRIDSSILSKDAKFLSILSEEKAAFLKAFPSVQREYIDYFIGLTRANEHRSPLRGAEEVVAESNNILNTPYQLTKGSEFRKIYLERYFPKTIAYMATKLNPDAYTK